MSNIITPSTLWNTFDDSLETTSISLSEKCEDGVRIEHVSFLGRDTGEGRVKVFGVLASDEFNPSSSYVMLFGDSTSDFDENLMQFFVKKGYSVFMVDYRGEWEGAVAYTIYPRNIDYANTARCGRFKDFVDDTADKTSWYEWVAVGIYARKYLINRTGSSDIALVGLRDGGEIVWKLAMVAEFSCAVTVCAAGWKAYAGISKFCSDELAFDDERYRFIGGIDSQAYAPLIKCPMLMLCSTNDERFDYDRAYDTLSRINHEVADDSVITYSLYCDETIGVKSTTDMIMFLDKHLKHRHVFVPKPVEVSVGKDDENNLIAHAVFDEEGVVEEIGMYLAEDCITSSLREWTECPIKSIISSKEREFYLNIYEKTSNVLVLCFARYSNGFTVWSKLVVKKITETFANMQNKCRVIYSSKDGTNGFSIATPTLNAIGGIFFDESVMRPQIVTKAKGISGIYSDSGLTTYRFNSPKYAPETGNVLKLDVFCDSDCEMIFVLQDVGNNEIYKAAHSVLGGVWQGIILDSKMFKTPNGVPLSDFTRSLKFSIFCDTEFAINNVMWL